MIDKEFDCVEMKRRAQEPILKEIEGMTLEEELEYWREKSNDFRRQHQQRIGKKDRRQAS